MAIARRQLEGARKRTKTPEGKKVLATLAALAPYMEALVSETGQRIYEVTIEHFDTLMEKQIIGTIAPHELPMLAAYRQILYRWGQTVKAFQDEEKKLLNAVGRTAE